MSKSLIYDWNIIIIYVAFCQCYLNIIDDISIVYEFINYCDIKSQKHFVAECDFDLSNCCNLLKTIADYSLNDSTVICV